MLLLEVLNSESMRFSASVEADGIRELGVFQTLQARVEDGVQILEARLRPDAGGMALTFKVELRHFFYLPLL